VVVDENCVKTEKQWKKNKENKKFFSRVLSPIAKVSKQFKNIFTA
jgi:hypothetical protein